MFNPYAACPCPRDELCPLLEVVYLWGSILTTDAGARQKQSTFLNRALRRIVDAERIKINAGLGGQESPRSTLHLIQSHVLLANYFFNAGQFSQGRRHTADAVSLVVSHRFHKIRSPRPHDASHMHLVRASDTDMVLPLPADLAEEGERTHAFWQVYVLDKTWATVLCHPSLLVDDGSPETEIDTPWPLAMNDYVEVSAKLCEVIMLLTKFFHRGFSRRDTVRLVRRSKIPSRCHTCQKTSDYRRLHCVREL